MQDRGSSDNPVVGRGSARALTAAFTVLLALVAASVALGAAGGAMGRYIVVLKDSVEEPGAVGQAQLERRGGHLGFVYHHGPVGYSATLPVDEAAALAKDPRVEYVEPDGLSHALAQSPSTGIKRVFAFTNKALEIDEKSNLWVNADVAVIDGGFKEESDLTVTHRLYCDGTEKSATCKEGGEDIANGHGTRVASVIGAVDNTEGVVGVAPGVRMLSLKVLDPDAWDSEVIAAVNYVTAHAEEIEVANVSIGCDPAECTKPALKEAISNSVAKGVVYVVAAGNEEVDVKTSDYANNPDVITVSGIADYDGAAGAKANTQWWPSCKEAKQPGDTGQFGADDVRYSESNFGTAVDVTAPAVCIRSQMPGGTLTNSIGTSFATAEVSGAAAILASLSNPNSKKDVETIRTTIVNAGNTNWTDNSGDGSKEKLLDLSNETIFK